MPIPESGCWLWTACVDHHGYGRFTPCGKGTTQRAHIISYKLYVGPIPDGMLVLHSCDTPACVNPDHLHLGDQADNMIEASERGRVKTGTDASWSKVAGRKELCDSIREAYRSSGLSQTALAKYYDVTQATISRIINRQILEE